MVGHLNLRGECCTAGGVGGKYQTKVQDMSGACMVMEAYDPNVDPQSGDFAKAVKALHPGQCYQLCNLDAVATVFK